MSFDQLPLESILLAGAIVSTVIAFVVLVVSFINVGIFGIGMVRDIKEGTTMGRLWGSQFNAIYKPELLTAKGLECRRRLIYWLWLYLLCVCVLIGSVYFFRDY